MEGGSVESVSGLVVSWRIWDMSIDLRVVYAYIFVSEVYLVL